MDDEIPEVQPRGKIVLGLENFETEPAAAPPQAAPAPEFPPVAGLPSNRPAPAPTIDSSRSGYTGAPRPPAPSAGDWLLASAAMLWKLGGTLLVVLAIGGYIWGGTDAAHEHCLEHRILGTNSLIDNFACAVAH